MEQLKNKLEHSAEELEHLTDRTNIALAEMRLQFETMTEMQKQERENLVKEHYKDTERMRKHYGKIIACLILSLFVMICGIIGSVAYFFANYDIECYQFEQEVYLGGDGYNVINDGIHSDLD